jgi:hypothetical protein
MTVQPPRRRLHVADLLPAYLNGSLDDSTATRVGRHLSHCAACRTELEGWQALRGAALAASAPALGPDVSLMARVWAEIDAPARQPRRRPLLVPGRAAALCRLAAGQIPLLPRGIWIASAAVVIAGLAMVLLMSGSADVAAASLVQLVLPLVAAAGVAFTYGPEHDPGLEVALATPTSPRLVLLSRLALVFGYNICLALGVTLLLAVTRGFEFAGLASLWLGPMLLFGGLSLLLTVLLSTAAALTGVAAAWCLRFLAATAGALGAAGAGAPHAGSIWQTSPAVLAVAVALLVVAVLYVPRQRRLA